MSTVISEGLPIDGTTTRIFEPPKVNQDNTKPRYLGFIGSFITPEIATARSWTRGGGMEIANPCLRYVKNFLRRGRITPLLRDTHDFLPYDFVKKTTDIDPLSAGYFAQQIPAGYKPPALPPPNGGGMLGLGAHGGDDSVDRNIGRKGIVEFTELAGREYKPQQMADGSFVDPELFQIQKAIFPDYPVLPPTLDELAVLLNAASRHTELRSIVDTFQTSLDEFRNYADILIQNVNQQMKERGPNGYVRPYTAVDLVLLDQLGMERQDRMNRSPAPNVSDSDLKDILAQFMKAQLDEKQELARMRAEQATAVPVQTVVASEIEYYTCEHCGEQVKVKGKGFHIGRHCKVLNAKKVVEPAIEPAQEG